MNNLKHLFNSKKKIFTFIILLLIASIVPLTVLLSQQQQETRQRASTQLTCLVDTAKCKWDTVSNASSYIVTITDSSGLTVKSQIVGSTVNELSFSIQAGKTYTCSVKAKNSCGESAPNSSAQSCQQ